MNSKKSILIITIVILAISSIGIFILTTGNKEENKQENKLVNSQNTSNVQTNVTAINEQKVNETLNVVENNEVNTETNSEESKNTEVIEGGVKSAEDKSIEIVKNDWKGSKDVDIGIDGINADGNMIVTVRDKNTTQALAFYTVNISNGTFTKKEMN